LQFQKNSHYNQQEENNSQKVPSYEDLCKKSTDNTDTDTAISQTEHNNDTETETDATMSEMDNITDTNTDTDGQVTAHNSTDNNEPILSLQTIV
jgi:hypothetical protein